MTLSTKNMCKVTLTAIAMASQMAIVPLAHAQATQPNVEELRKQIAELKARIDQLETATKALEDAGGPIDKEEFNRVKTKTEALEDQKEAQGFRGLKISGYADPTWIYNKNQKRAGFQFLNPVAEGGYSYDDSYFGVVSLDLLKEMDNGVMWHLTLVPGRGTSAVVNGDNSIVQEASVQVPLDGLATKLIAGHIPDWSGYEYQPAPLNKLISHNLLFDFTLPTAYTGAGLELVRGAWDTKLMFANVNSNMAQAGRRSPAFVARTDYAKGEFSGLGGALVLGKMANYADPAGADSNVAAAEVDGFFIRGDWTVQGQLSVGKQAKAAITPAADGSLRDAQWWGMSGLVAYKFAPRWETTARLDYLNNRKNGGGLLGYTSADDRNGIGPDPMGDPDVGANRSALSLGLSYQWTLNTTFKMEYRLDHADQPVFIDVSNGGYSKNNQMLGTAVVVTF
jgi:outer membrane murein-binding lipoprotein Lpp